MRQIWRILRHSRRKLVERGDRLDETSQERIRELPLAPAPALDDAGVPQVFQRPAYRPALKPRIDGLASRDTLGNEQSQLVRPADALDDLLVGDAVSGHRGK